MRNVMVDIEGLGEGPDGVILQIGAVDFELDGTTEKLVPDVCITPAEAFTVALGHKVAPGFFCNINIDSSMRAGLKVDGRTIKWWMGGESDSPNQAAREALWAAPIYPIREALNAFQHYVEGPDVWLWANPTSYDLTMIASSYQALGRKAPWRRSKEVDCRSYAKGFAYRSDFYGIEHHATWDAARQAVWMRGVYALKMTYKNAGGQSYGYLVPSDRGNTGSSTSQQDRGMDAAGAVPNAEV
jgi:hypothetical protein